MQTRLVLRTVNRVCYKLNFVLSIGVELLYTFGFGNVYIFVLSNQFKSLATIH